MPHGICRPAEQARQSLSSLSKLSLEDFRNVEQSANAARNAQKAKYQGMLSLYLNVIYQIIKNMCISTPAMRWPLPSMSTTLRCFWMAGFTTATKRCSAT